MSRCVKNLVVVLDDRTEAPRAYLSWNAHFYLFLPTFYILRNQVTTPSLHMMARKYSHVMVCHMSDCVVLVDQARDESRG